MNKNLFYLIFGIVLFASCAVFKRDPIKANRYEEIREVAISELPQFTDKIPIGAEELYGFKSRNEISQINVGSPFVFFVLENGDFKKTETYRLPVMIEKEYKALITVENIEGNYHIVDFGANVLASEIQLICETNAEMKFEGIFRVYTLNCDFVVMYDKNELLFFPLTSAKMYFTSLGMNPHKYYTKDQIIKIIK